MKFFNVITLSLLAFPALAEEITSPFYLPEMGHILNQTGFTYIKKKRTTRPTTRLYQRTLSDQITLGLGAGLAAVLEGDIAWQHQKQNTTLSYPHTKAYGAGLKGQWEIGGFLSQVKVLYQQSTNVQLVPRRTIWAETYLGKKLTSMTPYLHLVGNFPIHARKDLNAPLYRAETGVFQTVNKKTTLDTALFLQYDQNIQERSYGIQGEVSYLMTPWASIGLNGQWQARGHAKGDTKTYFQRAGINVKIAF